MVRIFSVFLTLCLLLTRYTLHKKHFSIMENIIVPCFWLPLPPAPSLTSQLEHLTGSSSLGQLPIAPRPYYSAEKSMLDLSQQSLPCLPVRSHPVSVVSSLWKFLHLKTQLYPRWKFQRFYTLHLKNI